MGALARLPERGGRVSVCHAIRDCCSHLRTESIRGFSMRLLLALVVLIPLASPVSADEDANRAVSSLARENVFALGGVGVAGIMSSGESDLRAVLKETGAVQQLQSLLKKASPAGQLYALLGLRLRDRPSYEQALPAFRTRSDVVSTMHGCIMMKEKMDSIVNQIEHGDYDSVLAAPPR